jgi:hypothetical protein
MGYKITYKIVAGSVDNLEKFEEEVSNLLSKGFTTGQLAVNKDRVFQAMNKSEYISPPDQASILNMSKNELKDLSKQNNLPVTGSKAQLISRLLEGEVTITVKNGFTFKIEDFDYDNSNTFAKFIEDLEDDGNAGMTKMAQLGGIGISVDGALSDEYVNFLKIQKKKLSEIGVKNGSVIELIRLPLP